MAVGTHTGTACGWAAGNGATGSLSPSPTYYGATHPHQSSPHSTTSPDAQTELTKGRVFLKKKKKTPKMPLKRFSLAAYGGNTAPRFVLSSCQQETPRSGCSPISSSCVITPRN